MAPTGHGGRFETRYIGPSLAKIADPTPVHNTLRRIADRGGDAMHGMAAEFTPIRTGNLATSWYREPTQRKLHGSATAYESRIATDVSYAPYVEYGTGLWGPEGRKYLIEPHPPNKVLSWIDPHTGRRMFARRVWHTGSEGHHMTQKAAAMVEGFLHEMMFPELERWKYDTEVVVEEAMRGVVIPR